MLNLSSKKEAIFYLCGSGGEQNIAEAFKEAKDKKQCLYLTLRLCCPPGLSRR